MSAFRDRYPEIADAAQVLGVSTDTLETQKKFARRRHRRLRQALPTVAAGLQAERPKPAPAPRSAASHCARSLCACSRDRP